MRESHLSDWFVYMVQTRCDQLYTGISTDVTRRFQEHVDTYHKRAHKGAKYFRGREPLKVVYQEGFVSRSEASKRECQIKKMTARKKRALITES